MDDVQLVFDYFPELDDGQRTRFAKLEKLYGEWNTKINVISRKDIDNFYVKHCLHSLGIAKIYSFQANQKILDVGTGGGFPGIPLAILFPQTKFTLIDAIGKKIKVVDGIIESLALENINTIHGRAENVNDQFDFIVSRAVTRMQAFYQWTRSQIRKSPKYQPFQNGILYLKGGDLAEEMAELGLPYSTYPLSDHFKEEFFETKQVIHLPIPDKRI